MLNPYYDKSADVCLNLGGTAVIFALSVLIYTWGFFIRCGPIGYTSIRRYEMKDSQDNFYHFQNEQKG